MISRPTIYSLKPLHLPLVPTRTFQMIRLPIASSDGANYDCGSLHLFVVTKKKEVHPNR